MDYRQCTATSKRSGERCKGRAVNGSEVCYMHGGKTPKGAASPHFKTGKYSTALPQRMIAAYEAATRDPELLDLKQSVALIDARLLDLLSRVDSGESGALWSETIKAFRALRRAYRGGDHIETMKAFGAMEIVIDSVMQDYAAWGEIQRLLDDRRKHIETQANVALKGEKAITAEQLMAFMGAVMSLIQTTVKDKQERIQIADGMERIVNARGAQIQ